MPFIVGKESVSATIGYYKGNPFEQQFLVFGDIPPTNVAGKISRVGDPDMEPLVSFSDGNGLSVSFQEITLTKTAQQMVMPPGQYELALEASIGGVSMKLLKHSYFIVFDSIAGALPNTSSIVATAVSDSVVNVAFSAIAGATTYTLRRSLDGLIWSVIYSGPNTNFIDTGLEPSTQYYYDVSGSGPGVGNSPYSQTNTTTLPASGGSAIPRIVFGFVNPSDSNVVRIVFSKDVQITNANGVSISSPTSNPITGVAGSGGNFLDFTVTNPIASGSVVSFSYNPSVGDLRDLATPPNELPSVVNYPVANWVPSARVITLSLTEDGVQAIPAGTLIQYIVAIPEDTLPGMRVGTVNGGEDISIEQPYVVGANTIAVNTYYPTAVNVYFTGVTSNTTIFIYYA